MTADTVIDDPREPRITPTGVLDHRGMMLVRVSMPIKVEMGFRRLAEPEPDTIETIMPEDMLAVSDCGLGQGYIDIEEVEGDEPSVDDIVRAALEKFNGDPVQAKAFLAKHGMEVTFTTTGDE